MGAPGDGAALAYVILSQIVSQKFGGLVEAEAWPCYFVLTLKNG